MSDTSRLAWHSLPARRPDGQGTIEEAAMGGYATTLPSGDYAAFMRSVIYAR